MATSLKRFIVPAAFTLALAVPEAPLHAGFAGIDLFVPSVGARSGVPPSVWYTTVWLHNPGAAPANVTVYLLERDKANAAPLHVEEIVPPGETRRWDNAVELLFARKVFGALRVTSSEKVIVSSRVYSQSGSLLDESVGQFFAGIPASFAIGAGESTEIIGGAQTQPSSTSTFRFNYGFVETTGAGTCQVLVTVKDQAGAVLGSKAYTVRQWEQVQKALKDEFPSISDENVRLTVEVEAGSSGRLLAFGSTVANGSQDASTLEMRFADELLVAGVGSLATGGVTFGGTSGQLAQDAATLFWDDAADRLGIGTATPAEQLELTGNLRLPATTATTGQVFMGSDLLLHAYGTNNFFVGPQAGNLTLTTALRNTGLGRMTLDALTEGESNTAVGFNSLSSVTTGSFNTAVGRGTMPETTTASHNTAIGVGALFSNTVGEANLAAGRATLWHNVDGADNTAVGAYALNLNVNGSHNTAVGRDALYSTTAGTNTAVGWTALRSNTTGDGNVGLGSGTLWSNSVGSRNTAVGEGGTLFNNTADNNTAIGWASLHSNTTGAGNVGLGANSLWANTEGSGNTAIGDAALFSNVTGGSNTAVGAGALLQNTSGNVNTAVGNGALGVNTTGFENTGIGAGALGTNTEGYANTAIGLAALGDNTTGASNAALGFAALRSNVSGTLNAALGRDALWDLASGGGNVGIGAAAGVGLTTGSNNVYVAAGAGAADEEGVIRVGTSGLHTKVFTQGISGVAVTGDPVYVQPDGQLGTVAASSRQLKRQIETLVPNGEWLERLRPVAFRYLPELDPSGSTQYGLIAEEVAEVAPELVVFSPSGQPAGVRYHLLSVLLLGELQEQYRVSREQSARIAELLRRVEALAAAAGGPAPR